MSKYYLRSIGMKDNILVTFYYGPFLTQLGAELARKQAKYPEDFEIFLSPYKTTDDLVSYINKILAYHAQKAGGEPICEAVAMKSMREVIDKPRFL
jgi:hypothetical protein